MDHSTSLLWVSVEWNRRTNQRSAQSRFELSTLINLVVVKQTGKKLIKSERANRKPLCSLTFMLH